VAHVVRRRRSNNVSSSRVVIVVLVLLVHDQQGICIVERNVTKEILLHVVAVPARNANVAKQVLVGIRVTATFATREGRQQRLRRLGLVMMRHDKEEDRRIGLKGAGTGTVCVMCTLARLLYQYRLLHCSLCWE
jgi:hypothetical protein